MKRRQALRQTAFLAGSTAVIPSLLSLLQSCQSQPALSWKPVFLGDQARLISRLVDMWLPRTETPGGLDLKVDQFIDLVFAKTYSKEDQVKVLDEIKDFNTQCKERFGRSFIDLPSGDQEAMLSYSESGSGKINPGVWGTAVGVQQPISLYRSLKSLALWAYFSSEEIGRNVLNYDPVPGAYQGCIPLRDVGNSWSF